jgi:hypothetical protein
MRDWKKAQKIIGLFLIKKKTSGLGVNLSISLPDALDIPSLSKPVLLRH